MEIFGIEMETGVVIALVSAITAIFTALITSLFKFGLDRASTGKISAETTDFLIKSAKELLAPYKEEADILRASNKELVKINEELKKDNEALKVEIEKTKALVENLEKKCEDLQELLTLCKECLDSMKNGGE